MAKKPQLVVAKTAEDTQRRTAEQIFEGVTSNARDELGRSILALFISGVAGGINMGLTGMSVAIATTYLGLGHELLANLLYPLGFIAVIIGRAQLFTENTLYPVVLVLDERKYLLKTLRLWATVFVANVLGATLFAVLAVRSGALRAEYVTSLLRLGGNHLHGSAITIFWSGVIGGWIIALVAWMVTASQYTIGQLAVIYVLAYLVGIGHFSHCIASSGEILAAVMGGAVSWGSYFGWLAPATLGNIVGGVVIVSLLNYGQVAAGHDS